MEIDALSTYGSDPMLAFSSGNNSTPIGEQVHQRELTSLEVLSKGSLSEALGFCTTDLVPFLNQNEGAIRAQIIANGWGEEGADWSFSMLRGWIDEFLSTQNFLVFTQVPVYLEFMDFFTNSPLPSKAQEEYLPPKVKELLQRLRSEKTAQWLFQ